MIVVIDYNVGNIKSVRNALDWLGIEDALSAEPAAIERADGIILPGVAAFGYAMEQLGATAEAVRRAVLAGKPLLGICVGFQLLFDASSELGEHKGLGLVKGRVAAIPHRPGLAIPHMGWNAVCWPDGMDLFSGLEPGEHFYFAHSYCADVADPAARTALTDYGGAVTAAVCKGNIYGVQFHPEKSGEAGMQLLRNFARLCMIEADRC